MRRGVFVTVAVCLWLALAASAYGNSAGMGQGCQSYPGVPQVGIPGFTVCASGSVVYAANGAYWSIDYYKAKYWFAAGAASAGCQDDETNVGPASGFRSGTGPKGYSSPDSGCSNNAWISRTLYGTSITYPGQTIFRGTFNFDLTGRSDPGFTLSSATF